MNLLILILLLNLVSQQECFLFPVHNAHHIRLRSPLKDVLNDNTESTKSSSIGNSSQYQRSKRILETSGLMFLLSAPLGMMLDNYHGLFGVLEYNDIGLPIKVVVGSKLLLKTASWVPILFGIAGRLHIYIYISI
jgi:hypothetical protein